MSKFSSLIGGGGGNPLSGLKQAAQQRTPLPKRTDTAVTDAAKRAKQAAKLRQGRRATILSGPRGVVGELGSVSRPAARSAKLLGETV